MNDTPTTSATMPIYPPSAEFAASAHADRATYDAMYKASIEDPDAFWAEHGKRVDWIKPFTKVKNVDYSFGNVSINWFEDGTLNFLSIAAVPAGLDFLERIGMGRLQPHQRQVIDDDQLHVPLRHVAFRLRSHLAERDGELGLGKAGRADQQCVTAAEDCRQCQVDHLVLDARGGGRD